MFKEFISKNEKIFCSIYWGCLLIFVILETGGNTLSIEETFSSFLTPILIFFIGIILIFSGLFNWQWAFRFPSQCRIESHINRFFGFLIGVSAIGISVYLLVRSIIHLF